MLSLSGSGLIQSIGSAAFNFNGGTFQAGSSFSTSVPLVLGSSGSGPIFDTQTNTLTLAGALSGSGGFQKTGSGTLILTASNSYSGNTTIGFGNGQSNVGGIVAISNGFALGTGSVTILAGNPAGTDLGAQLQLSGNITVSNPSITISGLGYGFDGGVILNTNGNNTINSAINLTNGAGGSSIGSAAGTLTLAGSISTIQSGRTLEFNGAGNIVASGVISDGVTNNLPITMNGTGKLTFAASNSYSGLTSINGGTLSLANSAALAGGGNLTFGGGVLQFSASNTQDCSSRIVNSVAPIAIDTNGQNVTFAGNLASTNTGGLTKLGAGKLTLTGSNGFGGNVNVTAGTLQLAAGQLPAVNEQVAPFGSASLAQSGGDNLAANLFVGGLGNEVIANGSYSLSGGQLTVTGNEQIALGLSATGSFTQTGGTHTVANLSIAAIDGNGNGGIGFYSLSSGQLNVTMTESIGVGYDGIGSFSQTGGSHSVPNLTIGGDVYSDGGAGSYTLGGGQLIVTGTESIGVGNFNSDSTNGYEGYGTFTQTGGTHSVAYLAIGALDNSLQDGGVGSYSLSGGQLTVTGTESIGLGNPNNGGSGSFTQSGGTHSVADIGIGGDPNEDGGNGSYKLSARPA